MTGHLTIGNYLIGYLHGIYMVSTHETGQEILQLSLLFIYFVDIND